MWCTILASTVLVFYLANSTWLVITTSLIFAYHGVQWAVLASTIFQNSLSQTASIWTTFGSISLGSSIKRARSATTIFIQSLCVFAFMWDASLSINTGSSVWVAIDTSSINLKQLSCITWNCTTLLIFPHCSCKICTFLADTIFSNDFSLGWNTRSTRSLVVESTSVWFAVFTNTHRQNSLSLVASWSNTLSAVWRRSSEWWAVFKKSILKYFLLRSTFELFTTSTIS